MEQVTERSEHNERTAPGAGTCPSCSSTGLTRIAYPSKQEKWKDLAVLVCQNCGFGFVPDMPFDLDKYYTESYGETHGRKAIKPRFFDEIDSKNSKKIKRSKSHSELLFQRFGKLGSVLDIGSGPGFFLHYVKADKKFAIESDKRSHEMIEATGAKVVSSLNEIKDLDAIVMAHVLEHFLVGDYRGYLKAALGKLKPQGVLLIEVPECPNIDANSERKNGKGHDPHTMFFSALSLIAAVDAADAELVYFHNKGGAYPITAEGVDWTNPKPKEIRFSSMLAIWRKA